MPDLHKRFRWWWPVVVLLASCAPDNGQRGREAGRSPAPAEASATPRVPVTVVTLKSQPITLKRELPGRTSAFLVAEVRPQVGGLVKERLFEEGAIVKAGQPLYQIEDSTYRAELASAKAALVAAQAKFTAAHAQFDRSQQLVGQGVISRQDFDNVSAALKQAEAEVGVAQAAVKSSQVTLDHARITSPITGKIGKSAVTKGALVTANQAEPLATVQQLDPVYVDLSAPAAEVTSLRQDIIAGTVTADRNVAVGILLDNDTRYPYDGKLTFADASVDPRTESVALRVVVPNPDGLLMPGMFVRAVFGNVTRRDAVLVPQRAISRDPKGNAIAMVVDGSGVVAAREVRVSSTLGDDWLVESGLAAGDRVIVEGLQKVAPGSTVEAVEAAREADASAGPVTG